MSKPIVSPEKQAEDNIVNPKKAKVEKPKCVVPDCGNEATCRGLCGKCYSAAGALVKGNKTTWQELEKLGLASPPKRDTAPNKLAKALLDRKTSTGK